MFKQETNCYEVIATKEFEGAIVRIYQLKNIENIHHRAVVSANVFLEEAFDIVNCKAIAVVINEEGSGGAIYTRDKFFNVSLDLNEWLPNYDIETFETIRSKNGKMWKEPFSLMPKKEESESQLFKIIKNESLEDLKRLGLEVKIPDLLDCKTIEEIVDFMIPIMREENIKNIESLSKRISELFR